MSLQLKYLSIHLIVNLLLSYFMKFWWIGMIVSLILTFIMLKKFWKHTILLNFVSIFVLWLFYCFIIDIQNDSILSNRIAPLFMLHSKYLLILVCAIIGGISGMIGGILGWNLKKIFEH